MNVFAKNWLWVFEAANAGGPSRIVDVAQSIGYGLCVKAFDGNPADDGDYFAAPLAEIRRLCQARGIPLIAWAYLYGNTYGNLTKEAEAVVATLDSGLSLVLDIESEWEVSGVAGRDWAQTLSDYVLARRPNAKEMLAYCPFWNMEAHPHYPAAELSRLCSAVMPQAYFALAKRDTLAKQRDMVETSYREYAPYGLPVYPIGEFGPRGVGDVAAFLAFVGGRPHGWWLLDGYRDSDEIDYLARTANVRKAASKLARIEEIIKEV